MTKPKPITTKPPAGLGIAGRALFAAVVGWSVDGAAVELRPDELAVLATAARTADTITQLEAELVGQPTTIAGSRDQLVVHPALVELRHQRSSLAVLLAKLNLPEIDAGSWDNLTATQRARKAARARWS